MQQQGFERCCERSGSSVCHTVDFTYPSASAYIFPLLSDGEKPLCRHRVLKRKEIKNQINTQWSGRGGQERFDGKDGRDE